MARKKMSGVLAKKGWARDLVPPLVGGVLAAGTSIAIRMWVRPDTPTAAKAYQWAPAIGIGVAGLLGGMSMYFLGDKATAASAAMTGAVVGASQIGAERLLAADAMAGALPPPGPSNVAGMSAVVPQYGAAPGMNAIVWEQLNGLQGSPGVGANDQHQGQTVNLRGVVETGAFGTSPFNA